MPEPCFIHCFTVLLQFRCQMTQELLVYGSLPIDDLSILIVVR